MDSLWDALPDDVQRSIVHEAQVMHGQSVRASKRSEVDALKARVRELAKIMWDCDKMYECTLRDLINSLPYRSYNCDYRRRLVVAKHRPTLDQLTLIKQQHLDARDELVILIHDLKARARPMHTSEYPRWHQLRHSLAKKYAYRMESVLLIV